MKKLITTIFILLVLKSNSQTPAVDTFYVFEVDTAARDTVPMLLPCLDTSHYFDVFRASGTLLKHNADSYYPVPTGGRRVKLGLISDVRVYIEGYEVWKTRLDRNMELVERLNALKERIGIPYINVGIGIPIFGL